MIKRRFIVLLLMVTGAAVAHLQGAAWVSATEVDLDALSVERATVQRGAGEPSMDELEREMILDMVRKYRPGSQQNWQETLADAVYETALESGVDPLMVAAIVARESSFQSQVVSHAGAVGLMQVRPFVARDVAERTGELEWSGVDTLHDPEANVRLGILYYQELVDRFDGDHEAALAAYNRGPTRVSREMRAGSYRPGSYPARILGLYRELDARRSSMAGLGSVG